MKTSIIILTHNKLEYTIQCIDSIRLYTETGSYEIIVVDNASTDETKNWLEQQKDLIGIMNSENKGFPAGCNQGIQVATGSEVLLLNNDTVVTRNWLDNLKEALYSDPTIGAVSCVTNNCSYGQAIETSYDSMSSMHDFAESINCSSSVELEERLKLVGFCMLIKTDVIDKVGLLDEQFSPGNYEDDDYSLRIRLAGYKLLLSRNTFIHHYGSVSFGEKLQKYADLLNTNSLKFEEKWGFNPNYSQHIRSEIVDLIRQDPGSNLKILEVGCACGGTLLNIKHHYKNAEIFGIELNPESARVASLIADVRAADIQTGELPYELEYFDYIIFADVLEHLSDPWSTIKNIKKYLRPTGRVLASIPNIMHYSVMLGLLKNGTWKYEDSGILDRTHLRFFTYESIQGLFKDNGFGKISITGKTLQQSLESNALIETLSSFSNGQLKQQFDIYQYIIDAENSDIFDIISFIRDHQDEDSKKVIFEKTRNYSVEDLIYQSSLLSKGDQTKVLTALGVINFENEKLDQVIPFFEKAISVSPEDAETLYNLSYFLRYVGEDELAEDYMKQLKKCNLFLYEQLLTVTQ